MAYLVNSGKATQYDTQVMPYVSFLIELVEKSARTTICSYCSFSTCLSLVENCQKLIILVQSIKTGHGSLCSEGDFRGFLLSALLLLPTCQKVWLRYGKWPEDGLWKPMAHLTCLPLSEVDAEALPPSAEGDGKSDTCISLFYLFP